jgi:hypothetical protein
MAELGREGVSGGKQSKVTVVPKLGTYHHETSGSNIVFTWTASLLDLGHGLRRGT